jgi:hypothetical protein
MFSSFWPIAALLQKVKKFSLQPIWSDEAFIRDPIGQYPGDVTVPATEPHWDCNTPEGMQWRVHKLEAILINYNKVKGIIQRQKENSMAFYDRLEEALLASILLVLLNLETQLRSHSKAST